ncbi:Uncharacterised protein [Chlamydia trachomatis]|nr:Uncharacterised protein [Chlamydia trachomatis]
MRLSNPQGIVGDEVPFESPGRLGLVAFPPLRCGATTHRTSARSLGGGYDKRVHQLVHPLIVSIFNLVTLLKEVDEDWEVVAVAVDE